MTSTAMSTTDPQIEGFDPSWRSFAAVQGGLVSGYLLQAAADVVAGTPRTFTTHFLGPVVRTPPAAGAWLRIRQRMTWLDDEVAVDDAVMHDERGQLTAVVRQTRRTPRDRTQP